MTEFVFISANDIHISDTGPRSRIDDFKDTILGKIAQMRTACDKLGADAALIAGDLYNLKTPSRNSHQLNQDLIKEFRKFPCPIYMIPGNHDISADNLNSLAEQPLGVLFADGTLINLENEIVEKDGKKISLVGIPYRNKMTLNDISIPDKGDCDSQVCLLHVYAGPKGGKLFNEILFGYDELAKTGPDVFVIGHYHLDQGIQEVDGKYFVNIGSMSRGSLSEENIEHEPQIGLIRISCGDVDPSYNVRTIKLKIKPASEVFDLKKREEEKEESKEIQIFVEKLAQESSDINMGESADVSTTLNGMDMAKAVRDKVNFFLQEAATKK